MLIVPNSTPPLFALLHEQAFVFAVFLLFGIHDPWPPGCLVRSSYHLYSRLNEESIPMVELERRKQNSLFAPTQNCQTEQDPIIVIRMRITGLCRFV